MKGMLSNTTYDKTCLIKGVSTIEVPCLLYINRKYNKMLYAKPESAE